MSAVARLGNRLRLSAAYLAGEPDAGGWPMELTIELTNRCDLGCIMCPRNWAGRPVGDMDLDLFRSIVDQAAGHVGLVDLCLAGESLLHPQVFEAIEHLGARGVGSYLQTSGVHVEGETAERLLTGGLDVISFSIDGADADTYASIRVGGELERVERNLEAFLARRRELGRGPYTVVQLIVQRRNAAGVDAFRRRWQGSGVDAVRIKPLGVNRGHVRRLASELVRPPAQGPHPPCIRTWRSLTVYWDGRVAPCCYDFDGSEPLGDLTRERLVDVWRGQALRELRSLQAQGRYDEIPLCRDCNRKNLDVSRAVAGLGSLVGGTATVLRRLPLLDRLSVLP